MAKGSKVYRFSDLSSADLLVDATYEGGNRGHAGDDPISKLLMTGNQGGFRYVGTLSNIKFCVLYSELSDPNWPDLLEVEMGRFIYFGDNKNPGHELHDTRKRGNLILRNSFNALHLGQREMIPPFFVFTKGASGRDVVFRGLAVPGAKAFSDAEDLSAVWKTADGNRFQNYRAVFTIMEVPSVSRKWIRDIHTGLPMSADAPKKWIEWIRGGRYVPLVATRSLTYRTKAEQLPSNKLQMQLVGHLISFFKRHKEREYAFERCAAEIVKLMDTNVINCDLTRYWRDGGRDAIGEYKIGPEGSGIRIDFAMEAKCKNITNGSGVRDTSRLISRLRYRQFGIFVTTSYVHDQAYKEIAEDMHPVIILSGRDLADILIRSGHNSIQSVNRWLFENFL